MTRGNAAAIALLVGFAVMCLELTGIRLLAPYFGDSAYVWTNVIGIMLVALALGSWIGGRMADRGHGGRRLAALLVLAAMLVALVPPLAKPLGLWLLPQDLPLEAAMGALMRGSLAASLVLFGPPVLLLGAVTPILVARVAERDGHVGGASGMVSALATLGSLLGTFAATHFLVPGIGSRATTWSCAGLLIACAALAAATPRPLALLAVPLGLGLCSWGPLRPAGPQEELLAEVESPYQFLQVVQQRAPSETATLLRINEGLDSFHSVKIEGSDYTGGRYYDYHAVAPFLAGDGQRPQHLRVLSLGAAAGSFNRLYAKAHPGCVVDGVEIDRQVTALGQRWFGGWPAAGRSYSGLDARVFVGNAHQRYHVVLVDTYERQIYIPAHVASQEFFAQVGKCLEDGGVVSVNAGALTFDDPVLATLGSTMASVFGEAMAFHVPQSRNYMIVARKLAKLEPSVLQRVHVDDAQLQQIVERTAQGAWRRMPHSAPVLHDDRPFLDLLQERAFRLVEGRDLTPVHGSLSPRDAVLEAVELLRQDRPSAAFEVLEQASSATADLRLQIGDCRWRLHDVGGAVLEYEDAQRLHIDPSLEAALHRRLLDARDERDVRRRGAALAGRNAWVAACGALVLGLLAALCATKGTR